MIKIIPSEISHVYYLTKTMREADANTAVHFGVEPGDALLSSYQQSLYSRTALINGRVAAMWGLAGIYLGDTGNPWLLTGKMADCTTPFRFLSIYGEELYRMLDIFPVLEHWADASHVKSLRLLKLFGFILNKPEPLGSNGALFVRAVKCK